MPVYILGPVNPGLQKYYDDMKGCELAENIIYLGKCFLFCVFFKILKFSINLIINFNEKQNF